MIAARSHVETGRGEQILIIGSICRAEGQDYARWDWADFGGLDFGGDWSVPDFGASASSFDFVTVGVGSMNLDAAMQSARSQRDGTQYADAGNVATDAGPGCLGEQCLGPEDYARVERVFDAVSDALDTIDEACGLKCDVASVLIPGGAVLKASKVAKATKVRELGQFTIKTKTVPGRGPGQSRAEITVIRNAAGRVIRTFKDTFDRANRFMHRKPLRGGPEGRAP